MVIWLPVAGVVLLCMIAEALHGQRLRRVAHLAFGPGGRPAAWTRPVPFLRTVAATAVAWGLLTLLFDIEPKVHGGDKVKDADFRHLVMVLDVSPSMRLQDAGPEKKQSRLHRARDVLNSMFSRIAIGSYKISVVATYNGAMPVVVDTTDAEVVRNILGDLPMHYAFKAGDTRLFDGLEEAAKICKPWKPGSATLVVISDGDTIPPTGMPRMPPSVSGVLVVGVGDPLVGTFINGRNSRQDVSALRQMALRLGGTYHDGNKRHVATSVLASITEGGDRKALLKLTKREYALMAAALGALLLASIPWLLHLAGTRWQPGRRAGNVTPPRGLFPDRRTDEETDSGRVAVPATRRVGLS